MSDIAIRVECLTKQYTIETIQRRPNTLRDHLMNTMQRLRPPPPNGSTSYAYSALKDVSSEVKIRWSYGFKRSVVMFKGDIRFRIFYFDFFSNIEQIGTIYISNGSIYSQYME